MTALLWDVQEELLSQAEFLFEAWERSLDSALFTLSEAAAGPEERLRANVMALAVGGAPVYERLLAPVLARPDGDRYRTAAATLAVLLGAREQPRETALAAIAEAGEEGRWGLTRAFEIANRKGIGRMLARDLGEVSGPALAGRLQALAARRYDGKRRLCDWLADDDLEVARAAAMLARHSTTAVALRALLPLLEHDDPRLRAAAIESALIRGLPGSWQVACAIARGPAGDFYSAKGPPKDAASAQLWRRALCWLAIQADEDAHRQLFAALRASPGPTLLWAAGLSGRLEAVDLACELLDHPTLARLAGEVLCCVAGLPKDERGYWLDDGAQGRFGADADEALPALEDDNLDAELVPPAALALPLPDPGAAREWWSGQRPHLEPQNARFLGGEPLDGARLRWGMRELPTRRLQPLAIEAAMRSAGQLILDTRASARAQLANLDASAAEIDCQRGMPLM